MNFVIFNGTDQKSYNNNLRDPITDLLCTLQSWKIITLGWCLELTFEKQYMCHSNVHTRHRERPDTAPIFRWEGRRRPCRNRRCRSTDIHACTCRLCAADVYASYDRRHNIADPCTSEQTVHVRSTTDVASEEKCWGARTVPVSAV